MKRNIPAFLIALVAAHVILFLSTADACGQYFFIVEDGVERIVYSDIDPDIAEFEPVVYEVLAQKTELLTTENPNLDTDGMVQAGEWGW